jgi:hypothetical protein
MMTRPKFRKTLDCEMSNMDMFAAVEWLNSEMPKALDTFIVDLRAEKDFVDNGKMI